MIFRPTQLEGAWHIAPEPHADSRGFFARTWCREEFARQGLDTEVAQQSLSFNRRRGTLRGVHFQRAPDEETKIVRCSRGAIYDVIVDLRPGSATYLRWQGFELSAEDRSSLYIPKGFGHGFQTLTDDTEIVYQMSTAYSPGAAAGLRHDDPMLDIDWPLPIAEISERDLGWPDYVPPRRG